MTVEFDSQKISAALRDFYNATGIDMELLKTDFTPANAQRLHNNRYCSAVQSCAAGKDACRASDTALLEQCRRTRSAQTHICHAGLVDVAIPILYDDTIIGYIIFGRMKPDTDFSGLEAYFSRLGLDVRYAEEAYREIPFFDADKIQSVSNIATLLVKFILLENLLKPSRSDSIEKASAYIQENLDRDLSIQTISRSTSISKSVLYKAFHDHYHCTVGSYINAKRVEKSMELLTKTNLSVEEIAQRVGFSGASYYSKTFKKQTGLSPLQYRKSK